MMKIFRLMLVMAIVGLMTGCMPIPRIYLGADEVNGTVVDAETKEPLQDVIVLEKWEQWDGYEGGNYSANLIMNEVVTDEKGNYRFKGWWPRLTMAGHIEDSSPKLFFYKQGYLPKELHNRNWGYPPPSYKKSEWSGKTIELIKYTGSNKDYVDKLPGKEILIEGDLWGSRKCDWNRIPQFTAAMIKAGSIKITSLETRKCGVNPGDVEKILGKYIND